MGPAASGRRRADGPRGFCRSAAGGGGLGSSGSLFGFNSPLHLEVMGRVYGYLWRLVQAWPPGSAFDAAPLLLLVRSCLAPWEQRALTAARLGGAAAASASVAGLQGPFSGEWLSHTRLCAPFYGALLPALLDSCCDRLRVKPAAGERVLTDARDCLFPLAGAPAALDDLRALEASLNAYQDGGASASSGLSAAAAAPVLQAGHPAFEHAKTWARWAAAAVAAPPGGSGAVGGLERRSSRELLAASLRLFSPGTNGAAFAVAAMLGHIQFQSRRAGEDPLARPQVKEAAHRLRETALQVQLPLELAEAQMGQLLAPPGNRSRQGAAGGGQERGPGGRAGDVSVPPPRMQPLGSPPRDTAAAASGAADAPASAHAPAREAASKYRGDWSRRPIGSNEVGLLVRPLILVSDWVNHRMGLTGPLPSWADGDRAVPAARLVLGWARANGLRVSLRFLAEKQVLAWIALLWVFYKALCVLGPLLALPEMPAIQQPQQQQYQYQGLQHGQHAQEYHRH